MWMESFNSWYTVNGYEWAFLTVSREMHDVTESSNTRHSLTILTNVWIETLPFCRRVVRKPWYSLMASSLEWNDFVPFPSEHAVSMTTGKLQWQYKWQVWYSQRVWFCIMQYLLHAMEVGLSSEKLGFIFHCCHYFESDFEIDGAKLMRFSDIFARMTVSLILFVYHTCEYDFQWKSSEKKMANYRV